MNKESIRNLLRETHTDADLQAWFDPLNLRFPEEGTLEVRFPHALFSRWFNKERRKIFERELSSFFGRHPRIVYAKPEIPPSRRLFSTFGEYRVSRAKERSLPEDFGGQWSFETFIYNQKNEFAVSVAREVALRPQNPPYVPLVVAGGGTCGKTHLLRAMARETARLLPEGSVYLGTATELNTFFRECPDALTFKRKISRKKALFIDNAHDLSGYPELQQEMVFIADTFKDKNKPLVLTVDANLDGHGALDRQFRSRLIGGLILTLSRPDLDIRLRYAKAQCAAMRLHLKKDHLLPIAQRFYNLRAIQGIIAKITAYEKSRNKPISHSELQKILAGSDTLARAAASPSAIIGYVAEAFGVSLEEITGSSRKADVTKARQAAMYLCREFLGVSLSSLGRYFNGKNHATVLYACKKIEKILDSDKDMHNLVTRARKKFVPVSGA